jgi:photoactive yellow protein
MDFEQPGLLTLLEQSSDAALDAADFGVIKLDPDTRVLAYNRYEAQATGLSPDRVRGRRFFTEVGPCMDNALVAGRLAQAPELDVVLDYVFALQMKPVPVKLRLLASPRAAARYLLVMR